jgi:hypothetical protein
MEKALRRIRKLEELAAGPCNPTWLLAERRFMAAFLTSPLPPGKTEESRLAFLKATSDSRFDVRIRKRMRWILGRGRGGGAN